MDDIQFQDESQFACQPVARPGSEGLAALVQKWGLAKDERGAQYVLVGIAAGAAVVALVVYAYSFGSETTTAPPTGIQQHQFIPDRSPAR